MGSVHNGFSLCCRCAVFRTFKCPLTIRYARNQISINESNARPAEDFLIIPAFGGDQFGADFFGIVCTAADHKHWKQLEVKGVYGARL